MNSNSTRVLFLILPEVNLLDLAGPVQVFHTASQLGASYTLEYCASQTTVTSSQGLALANLKPFPSVQQGDLVIVPGLSLNGRTLDDAGLEAELRRWLQDAYRAGARIASICSGAFALGDAGLLDQRRCTTHWAAVPYLKTRYPRAQVLDMVLYVHDGPISTSAGIASGIDMALSLVEQQHGALLTSQVARYMVIYLRRNGAHSQISVYLQYRTHLHPHIHQVQDFLIDHATEPITLEQVADIAQMSVRSLTRAFKQSTGITITEYKQQLRLEIASHLLQLSDLTIEQVAAKCGFEDVRHFRRLWQRQYGYSPAATRRTMAT